MPFPCPCQSGGNSCLVSKDFQSALAAIWLFYCFLLSVAQSSLRLPLLINMAEEAADSDVDSSQQSNASDDQQLEDSSQVR